MASPRSLYVCCLLATSALVSASIWTRPGHNSTGASLYVDVAPRRLDIGSVQLSDVFSKVLKTGTCSSVGCLGTIEFETVYSGNCSESTGMIQMEIVGSYQENSVWSLENMLRLTEATLLNVGANAVLVPTPTNPDLASEPVCRLSFKECNTWPWGQKVVGGNHAVAPREVTTSVDVSLALHKGELDAVFLCVTPRQHLTVADSVSVRVEGKNRENLADMTVRLSRPAVDTDDPDSRENMLDDTQEICADTMGVLSVVVGLFSGIFGTAFKLLSLGCNHIA